MIKLLVGLFSLVVTIVLCILPYNSSEPSNLALAQSELGHFESVFSTLSFNNISVCVVFLPLLIILECMFLPKSMKSIALDAVYAIQSFVGAVALALFYFGATLAFGERDYDHTSILYCIVLWPGQSSGSYCP